MQLTRTRLLINRLRRQLFSHVKFIRLGAIIVSLVLLIGLFFLLRRPFSGAVSFFKQFTGVALIDHSGSTNFLILGIGGGNHDGFDLTDTIIFASVNRSPKSITLISVPRDVWITSLRAKINTAYHYGSQKAGTAGGILLAKSAVSEVINQPVDYTVILDFSTFAKAIDLVGGVDITVDRAFDDYRFPLAGKENDLCDGDPDYTCRYEHLHFSAGPQHLDGVTALKFVRSRYSNDEIEGTDFGRSKRQEKIIAAFAAKLSSGNSLRHPSLYVDLFRLFTGSVVTDITPSQYFSVARLGLSFRSVTPKTLEIAVPGQLYNPPLSPRYDNQWILLPKDNNPQIIFDFVASSLGTP